MSSRLYQILKIALTVAALTIVAYKLITFDGYDALFALDIQRLLWLAPMVLLMPLNMLLESLKWRAAVEKLEAITVADSVRATLLGSVGAMATPNRLGDFPTRVLVLKPHNRPAAIVQGFVSGWALLVVIVLAGIFSFYAWVQHRQTEVVDAQQYTTALLFVCIAVSLLIFALPAVSAKLLKRAKVDSFANSIFAELALTRPSQNAKIILIAAARYATFALQYFLALKACGIDLSPAHALTAIPTIYLFTTITPAIELTGAAVRAGWSIFVLPSAPAPMLTLAAMLVWFVNTLIPMCVGMVVLNKTKSKTL